MNIFANILFGHLFGDFVFQPKAMAVNKNASNFICFLHCLIYTLNMCVFTWRWDWQWFAFIFITHFIIDRWSLADVWLNFIEGRALDEYLQNGHEGIPNTVGGVVLTAEEKSNYHILRGGFASVVYTVVDNTFHLALAYLMYSHL